MHKIARFILIPLSTLMASAAVAQTSTPVSLDPLAAHRKHSTSREWRAPDYSEQSGALGWTPTAFDVPEGMERQVKFWTDIYTRYNTRQGVIHDAEMIDLVYEVVDFSSVDGATGLSSSAKEKLKRKMVEDAKERAVAALKRIDGVVKPTSLSAADRRLWFYFRTIEDVSRIREAMDTSRIRFQLGQADRMQSAIFLSGRYIERFEKIFRDSGLPAELTRLVFVESSFNVLARSKVGASGLWQLMPGTVKPFRIISTAVDGRNDPWTATRIAARVLTDNYRRLQSWPLAVTGYNHGPTGVAKIVDRYDSRDLAHLIQNVRSRASFGFASRNFYASFLAALHVEKNARRYFPNIVWSQPLESMEMLLPRHLTYHELLGWFSRDDDRLQIFNPHLTWRVRQGVLIPKGSIVHVPMGRVNQARQELSRGSRVVAALQSKNVVRGGSRRKPKVHRVNRGENLSAIASEYGVSLREILAENNLDMDENIIPGQRIRIPR